ncbi:MAG: asparaginase [Candidatus Eisenbacteria bacterium]|nr:asparaginase [Candidatus Eisenbacteria bacterium]
MVILANCEGLTGMPAARDALEAGRSVLDVVEQGVRAVEADPRVHSVGRGGHPNLLGEVECDAALMDGATRMVGAVGALSGYLHAVSVARELLQRLPHAFLVGAGAARFAAEVGAEPAEMLTPEARGTHERWLAEHLTPEQRERLGQGPLAPHAWRSSQTLISRGTVVVLARNARGEFAVGTSTSGWARKYPGRIGDTAVVGAGFYVDDRYGACACTHSGEMILRAGTSRAVVLAMQRGATMEEACADAIGDLARLRGGYLGPVLIHTLDRHGRAHVVSTHDYGDRFAACLWREGSLEIERVRPCVLATPGGGAT